MRPVIDGSIFTILQTIIQPEKQDRVLSIVLSGNAASAFFGLLIAGSVVDSINLPVWFLLAGIVYAGVGISGFFIGSVLNMEQVSTNPQEVIA
jgi:hypothetical protein